jgi:hypothetical protein
MFVASAEIKLNQSTLLYYHVKPLSPPLSATPTCITLDQTPIKRYPPISSYSSLQSHSIDLALPASKVRPSSEFGQSTQHELGYFRSSSSGISLCPPAASTQCIPQLIHDHTTAVSRSRSLFLSLRSGISSCSDLSARRNRPCLDTRQYSAIRFDYAHENRWIFGTRLKLKCKSCKTVCQF